MEYYVDIYFIHIYLLVMCDISSESFDPAAAVMLLYMLNAVTLLIELFQVKKRKPKKCILFWKDINLCGEFEFLILCKFSHHSKFKSANCFIFLMLPVSGRCLPPIIIRDSSYYCICVAWELNKSDHWVSGSYPLPCVSKMAVIFYLLNSEEILFLCAKGL